MERQSSVAEISFPTRICITDAVDHVAAGQLPALLASKPDNWAVSPTSVATYLRGKYVMRRKGRAVRRGVKLKPTEISWVIDITEERKRTDAQGNVSFEFGAQETLTIHKVTGP
ncbi:hypothetical protein [Xanthomonas phage RTH11]|nr:hypothetical protein [Xanthomonas phage RTH11]